MPRERDPQERARGPRGRSTALALVAVVLLVAGALLALGAGDDPGGADRVAATDREAGATGGGPARTDRDAGASTGADPPTTAPVPTTTRDLEGRVVVLDPGHNGANGAHPAQINRRVDVGNGRKACNTTGTASASGLAESRLNWLLSREVRRALQARGARVVLTRRDDRGVGPCVDRRARIANRADADAAVSIHGDGGPAGGRGFHVILPGPVPQVTGHDRIVGPSARLGRAVRGAYRAGARMPYSTYLGRSGLDRRTDLGGLNLLTVPGVMLETGNMQNATDATLMADAGWRRRAARAIATGIGRFLAREG